MQRTLNDDDVYIVHPEKKHIYDRVSYKNSGYGSKHHPSVTERVSDANKKHGPGHVALQGREINDQDSYKNIKEETEMDPKYQAPFTFAEDIASSFAPAILTESSTHDDGTKKSTGNAFDLAAFKKKKEDETLRNHDKQKTASGTVYKRKEDAKGADTTDTKPEEKRGRGRPPGKYGSYKKRIQEALEINELSKDKLSAYTRKAAGDAASRAYIAGGGTGQSDSNKKQEYKKAVKRLNNIPKALSRLAKEDTNE